MIYEVGMLCKHFKGSTLYDKNIYRILELNVDGTSLHSDVTYSGDGDVATSRNLVVYENIFQNHKKFAREYEDISSELSEDKKKLYNQELKVQPLTEEEKLLVKSDKFVILKEQVTKEKYK